MKRTTKQPVARWTMSILAASLVALALALTVQAGVGNLGNPGVLPPQSAAFGKTYDEWAAEWVKWVCAAEVAANPMIDPTGAHGGEGQSGNVWFLAGVGPQFGGSAERTITVPAGKALFFPVLVVWWTTLVPNDTGGQDPWEYWEENEGWIRPLLQSITDSAFDLYCEIDGVPVNHVEQYRAYSPEFMVTLPEDNIFDWQYADMVPAGQHGPSVDVGSYYLLLAPLPVGEHEIRFGGAAYVPWDPVPFEVDVIYHITVE